MSSQQRFCTQCGASLGPAARFCGACGQAVQGRVVTPQAPTTPPPTPPPAESTPPPPAELPPSPTPSETPGEPFESPPAPQPAEPDSPPPSPEHLPAARAHRRRLPGGLRHLVAILFGTLLVAVGLRGPVLGAAGAPAAAAVTGTSQVGQYPLYRVHYRFATAKGEHKTGAFIQPANDASALPSTDSTIEVRYLPVWPSVNIPAERTPMDPASLLLTGAGLFLLVPVGILGSLARRRG